MNKIAIISIIIGIAVIILGFLIIDSPWMQRDKRIDQRRINDLQSINSAIQDYWRVEGTIPESIDKLSSRIGYPSKDNLKDPVTGKQYEYEKTGDKTYKICADFLTDNLNSNDKSIAYPYPYMNWGHHSGRYCFSFEAIESNDSNSPPLIVPIPE